MARAQNRTLLHLEEGNCDTGCHTEELEDIMQSEVSRSQKTVRVGLHFPGAPGSHIQGAGGRMVGARGRGRGNELGVT